MRLEPISALIPRVLPHGYIWTVIRAIAAENASHPRAWSVAQWQRFCDAFEATKGNADQTLANPLWQTYRIAKELLDEDRGPEINWTLEAIVANREAASAAPLSLPTPLVRSPRRRQFSDDIAV